MLNFLFSIEQGSIKWSFESGHTMESYESVRKTDEVQCMCRREPRYENHTKKHGNNLKIGVLKKE